MASNSASVTLPEASASSLRLVPFLCAARAIFEAAEQARVESIGANAMKGVARNLEVALEARLKQKGYANARGRDGPGGAWWSCGDDDTVR